MSEASVRQLSMQVCVQTGYALIALHTLGLTSPSSSPSQVVALEQQVADLTAKAEEQAQQRYAKKGSGASSPTSASSAAMASAAGGVGSAPPTPGSAPDADASVSVWRERAKVLRDKCKQVEGRERTRSHTHARKPPLTPCFACPHAACKCPCQSAHRGQCRRR